MRPFSALQRIRCVFSGFDARFSTWRSPDKSLVYVTVVVSMAAVPIHKISAQVLKILIINCFNKRLLGLIELIFSVLCPQSTTPKIVVMHFHNQSLNGRNDSYIYMLMEFAIKIRSNEKKLYTFYESLDMLLDHMQKRLFQASFHFQTKYLYGLPST